MNKVKFCFQCIVLSLFIWGDVATANDLSGFWSNDGWGEMSITQNGQEISAVYTNPSTDLVENYGFKIGDQAFYGTFSDQSLTGKVHLHFPVGFQATCPEQWDLWDDLELTLSEDGSTLQGQWKNSNLNSVNCTLTDGGWNSVTLSRKIAQCDFADSDDDGVPDQCDICPDTPRNSLVNKNGCHGRLTGDIDGDGRIGLQETVNSLQVAAGMKTCIDKSFLTGEWEFQNSGNQYRMRVEWDSTGERFEGALTKLGQASEYAGFVLGELCWIAVPSGNPDILSEQQKCRSGSGGVSTGYEWKTGTIDLGECSDNLLTSSTGKYSRVTDSFQTTSDQTFLTGEWESRNSGNQYRMRVELNESKQRFEGFLSKQGQASESVGFVLGELCWIAVPGDSPNILLEQQKYRWGSGGVSTGYEWRNGTVSLTECSDNEIVTSSGRSFLKISK